jgi:quercetin dioxygenase-like cupin family protein
MNHLDLGKFLSDTPALGRSTTVVQEPGLRTLLLHLKAGEHIPEHQARGAITVQCLKGEAIFASGAEQVTLTLGSLISLPPGVPHSVAAQQETLLLVTMCEQVTMSEQSKDK